MRSLGSLEEKLDAEANEELEINFCVYKHCKIRALKIRSLFFKSLRAVLRLKCIFILLFVEQ